MPPRPRLAVLPALLLVLAGCGDDAGGDDREDDRGADAAGAARSEVVEDVSACGELTEADVERLTGATVTREEKQQPLGGSVCTFTADRVPVVTVYARPGDDSVEEIVEATSLGEDGEVSTEEVDVPGTQAAAVVTDTAYDITSTALVASTGSVAYTVYGSGATAEEEARTTVALLTILLGGSSDAPTAAPAVHPCDLLTAEEVSQVVGAPATAERGTLGTDGPTRCFYGEIEEDVSVFTLDRTASVESLVEFERGRGVEVEDLDVEGATAYLLEDRPPAESVTIYLAAPGGNFNVTVDAEDAARSSDLARALAPLLAP